MGKNNGKSRSNGNGSYDVGEPEYFLPAILAGDPILYLVDGEGNLIDAEGNLVPEDGDGAGLSPGLRKLQKEAMESDETLESSGAEPAHAKPLD